MLLTGTPTKANNSVLFGTATIQRAGYTTTTSTTVALRLHPCFYNHMVSPIAVRCRPNGTPECQALFSS